MARSPLASGLLSGKINENTRFPNDDHRSGWLKGERLISLLKRINILEKLSDLPLSSISKRFLLGQDKIDKIIFGVKKIDHVDQIINDLNANEIEKNICKQIFELNLKDFGLINEQYLGY